MNNDNGFGVEANFEHDSTKGEKMRIDGYIRGNDVCFFKGSAFFFDNQEPVPNGFLFVDGDFYQLNDDGCLKEKVKRKWYKEIALMDQNKKIIRKPSSSDIKENKEKPHIQIGDIVHLKSGGADMVVSKTERILGLPYLGSIEARDKYSTLEITCEWQDSNLVPMQATYDSRVLDKGKI